MAKKQAGPVRRLYVVIEPIYLLSEKRVVVPAEEGHDPETVQLTDFQVEKPAVAKSVMLLDDWNNRFALEEEQVQPSQPKPEPILTPAEEDGAEKLESKDQAKPEPKPKKRAAASSDKE